jgi:hypothetical protein
VALQNHYGRRRTATTPERAAYEASMAKTWAALAALEVANDAAAAAASAPLRCHERLLAPAGRYFVAHPRQAAVAHGLGTAVCWTLRVLAAALIVAVTVGGAVLWVGFLALQALAHDERRQQW